MKMEEQVVNNTGYYADIEMTARTSRITGHRGFSGINAENYGAVKRLCKGRSSVETALGMSAEAAACGADCRH